MLAWEDGLPGGSHCQRGLLQQLEMWHRVREEVGKASRPLSLLPCDLLTNTNGPEGKGCCNTLLISFPGHQQIRGCLKERIGHSEEIGGTPHRFTLDVETNDNMQTLRGCDKV